ncbi:MAG: helix-turn-helix domain-containing protein [Planctomycetota bacterium]|nr:helix-turn-helix domain-containing protein [Planctomycetota bacterium]
MSPQRKQRGRSGCPLNISLELFGDRWTLLIVRDLMFKGAHTFQDFMGGGEGFATNILTDRLELLLNYDVIDKVRMASDRRKFIYRLTSKGIDLAPVLVDLMVWAARYETTGAKRVSIWQMKHNREDFLSAVRVRWNVERRRLDREKANG